MATLWQDLRSGWRMLRQNPGYASVTILTLALGIGANGAIFSFVDAILLRPLPVAHPEELVKLEAGHKGDFSFFSSYLDYLDFQKESRTLASLAAYGNRGSIVETDGTSFLVPVCAVSPNYFPFMGVKAVLGRTFAEETASPNAPFVAVISHRFWQRRFGGDRGIAGRVVHLNKQACIILGVVPRSFRGTNLSENPDFWIPMHVWASVSREEQSDRGNRWLEVIGRLRKGTSIEQAQAEMEAIGNHLATAYPATNRNTIMSVISESSTRSRWAKVMGTILLAVAGLVLLVACVNIANLLLARAEGRQKEIAVKLALGAGRLRIIQQLLTESLLLALFGGGIALLLAAWIIQLLPNLQTSTLFVSDLDIRLDERVVAFTLLISLFSIFGFGLVPALRAAQLNLSSTLRQLSFSTTHRVRGWTLGNLLVVAQLALSLMLLVGAGLLARTFWNVRHLHPGFQSKNRLLFWMVPEILGYDEDQTMSFYRSLVARVQSVAGVEQVSLVQRPPLYPTEGGQALSVKIPRFEMPPGTDPLQIQYTIVWPNYFETIGTPILRGRTFNGLESRTGPGSILINETMAHRFWPNQDAVGKHMQVLNKDCEIIGVVQDGKYVTLREDPVPYMFLPIPQFHSSDMTLLVHTMTNPRSLKGTIEHELQNLARDLPAPEVSTLDEEWQRALQDERQAAILVSCMSALAIFLAAVGLYGLMSFVVKRRTQEIGVRMALGARAATVLTMVLRQSLGLVLWGTGLGLVSALVLTRFMASQLFGITTTDLLTYAAVSILLVIIGVLACFIPAQRASRVDPLTALRYE